MQVILKKDIPQLGRIGDLVKVRSGYARNFLIPKAWAVAASSSSLRQLDHNKKLVDIHKKKIQKDSLALADSLKNVKVVLERRVNESGKLYGHILAQEVVDELKKQDLNADRRDIEMPTIKEEGEYPLKVRLPGDVFAEVLLIVKELKEKTAEKKTRTSKAKKTGTTKAKKSKESADKEGAETGAETAASEE